MSFIERHIETAQHIIKLYDGKLPLHHYLKQFFATDKKYGSKDRKNISHACYCYFRLGKALNEVSVSDKIKAGIFLCTDAPGVWAALYNTEWLDKWNASFTERWAFVCSLYAMKDIFPLEEALTSQVDTNAFVLSHLIQPDLFLRVRPGKMEKVQQQLNNAGLLFEQPIQHCIALPNGSKADGLLAINKDVVVQDLSSQRVAELLQNVPAKIQISVWDCCAASGGKSLLVMDTLPHVRLTVSDVRPSIIHNLQQRFKEAGVNDYTAFVADLSDNATKLPGDLFDLVICDVPCSGSGTWGRTPEQLRFFPSQQIAIYSALQQQIVSKVIPAVKPGGFLLYITCSVFTGENETVIDYIQANSTLQLIEMKYLEGYRSKADTMFAALFTA